ncbi:MAG: hypothetical protein Q9180_008139, partial [Flavoplaca navasiana]
RGIIGKRYKVDASRLASLLANGNLESTEVDKKLVALHNFAKPPMPSPILLAPSDYGLGITMSKDSRGIKQNSDQQEKLHNPGPSRSNVEATQSPRINSPSPNIHIRQGSAAMAFRQFQIISQKYWYTNGLADARRALFKEIRINNPDKQILDTNPADKRFERLYQQIESLISS